MGDKTPQNKRMVTALARASWFPSFQIWGHIIKFPVSEISDSPLAAGFHHVERQTSYTAKAKRSSG